MDRRDIGERDHLRDSVTMGRRTVDGDNLLHRPDIGGRRRGQGGIKCRSRVTHGRPCHILHVVISLVLWKDSHFPATGLTFGRLLE